MEKLDEAIYRLPFDGATAMYDFYALYALWWELGSGRSVYGYPTPTVTFHGRQQRIDWMLEESARQVAQKLLSETWAAAVGEASRAAESYVIPPDEAFKWFRTSKSRMEFGRVLLDRIHTWSEELMAEEAQRASEWVDWDELGDLFADPMWQLTGYADEDGETREQIYGGPPWSSICYAAKDMQRKLSVGGLVPLLGSVDRFYDLEHNSATIGEKLRTMQVTTSDLNRRAAMTSAMDFLPVVSGQVKNIITASSGQLSQYEEGFIAMIRNQEVNLFEALLDGGT